jgi:hypothetical protein
LHDAYHRAVTLDEPPPRHVLLDDGRHVLEVLAGESNFTRQTLFLGIERRVPRDAPQGLLELRNREEQPMIDARPRFEPGREQAFVRIFFSKV